jgi:metal-sulfur cluster biosynthetic enzyme
MTAARVQGNIESQILDELSGVLDPCGVHNGTRLSLVELGMVEDVAVDTAGNATIRLLLDDPVCMYLVDIMLGVEDAARQVNGVRSATVEIIGDQLWSSERMSDQARAKIARWQEIRAGRSPLPMVVALRRTQGKT